MVRIGTDVHTVMPERSAAWPTPDWEHLRTQDALDMAVDLASGVVSNDGHLLTSARIHGAYLGLVAVEPTSEWALVAVVSEVDGTYVPMTLGTMVSTRRPELIVRGAAWWPGRG